MPFVDDIGLLKEKGFVDDIGLLSALSASKPPDYTGAIISNKQPKIQYNTIASVEKRLPEITHEIKPPNKPIPVLSMPKPYAPPTPEQEALETPWVDPVTAAVGGFTAPVKMGAGVLRGAISAGLAAITDYPIGVATELVEKKHPYLALPFAVITGMASGVTLERAIENKIIHAFTRKGVKPAQEAIDAISRQVKSAIDAGQPDEADSLIRNLATADEIPFKAKADIGNVPTVETPKRYVFEEPVSPPVDPVTSPVGPVTTPIAPQPTGIPPTNDYIQLRRGADKKFEVFYRGTKNRVFDKKFDTVQNARDYLTMQRAREKVAQVPAGIEHPKIQPDEKINAITLDEAGKLIAKGDTEVIHSIQEGVQVKGSLAMQDAIRNEEMKVIQQAKKGPEREAVKAKIQEIEPKINEALSGENIEPKWASFGSVERKKYYNEDTLLKSGNAEVYDFNDKKWYKVKDVGDYRKKSEDIAYFISKPAGEEKIWYRYGNIPESYRSINYTENKGEMGVSVYATPKGSSPFFADRETYSGKGRQVGWGSDGEPLIIPTGKWSKIEPEIDKALKGDVKNIVKVYQGTGRPDKQSIYRFSGAEPVLGEAEYYTSSKDIARKFGPNIESKEIDTSNFLVINSRDEWNSLTREINVFPDFLNREETFMGNLKPFYADRDKVVNLIKSKGYDGIIITKKAASERGAVEKLFGDAQIIKFKSAEHPVGKKAGEGKALKSPTPPPTPKSFDPETDTIADMVRKEGGISLAKEALKGEVKDRFSIKEGYGLVNNKTGKTLDRWVERAKEEGFLNEDATVRDFLDILRQDVDAKKFKTKDRVWSPKKQGYVEEASRDQQARLLKEQRTTKEISAIDLREGDTLKQHGEKFKVVNIKEDGTVTLKDGEVVTVDPDETIKYDRGTLKKGEAAPEPAFVKTDIPGEEQAIWRGKGFDAEFPAGKKITPEEMKGKPKPKIEGQEDIFAPTPKETEKQQGLFAGDTTADIGGYAPPRGTAASQYQPPKGLFAMEMPEIVEIAKAISGGKYPYVKAKLSHRLAAGLFRTSTGNIELKADIFKNPDEAQRVLSHEIGHLVDWLPDNDISRGNILGRIASLKKYMSKLLAEYPDSPNKVLTPQDRSRIRKEAERLAKGTAKTTVEVEEQIIKELPLKADDIMKIMNDVGGEIRQTDKKLYEWFAMLSGDEKKSILKEALKGRIPDWVSFKRTVIEGVRTVKKTIYETVDPRKKYHDMIIEEIKKRRLYQHETIMDELKALSKEWKPFDEAKVHPKYIKYRYSSKELYADSISVLFNDPALLKDKAPNYYKAFFAYLERKPEVSAIYEEIQQRLSRGYEDIFRQRDINIEDMFKRGEQAYAEALKKPPLQVWKSIKKSMVDVNTEAISKVKEVEKRGIKITSEANPRYWIEELPYMSGPVKQYYTDIENLVRNTASDVEIGKYLFARRAQTERATLANPLGMQQKNAIDYVEYLKAKNPEQHAKIEEAIRQFRALRATQITPEIESAEMFDDAMVKLMRDNEHYATFDIVKYIEKRFGRNISSHIHKQVGTLEDTANPFTATIMKDTAMLRTAHVTKTKKSMVSFLQQNFPGDIAPADTRFNGRYHEVVDPKDPNMGLIAFLHKGEIKGFYVDKEIADTFYKDPYKGGVILKAWMAMSQPLKDLLVSKNPWFMFWNIQRDLRSSSKQLPGASIPKMIWYGIKSAPDAYKDVIKDIHSLDVSEMYKGKMLITGRAYGKDVSTDSQLERMMQEFLIKPQEYNNRVIAPLKKFWDFMDKPGQFSERLFKIAGYKYLKANTTLPDKEIAHLVRTRAGSPDFMRGGQHRLIYNNVFLFSNAGKEGWRSSIEAYKENTARYIWKTIEYDILPKVAMFAAAGGLFGDDIKRWFGKVPERDKSNYQIVPIGETSDGKAIYFRIPHDFTGQAVAGLTWKAMNQYKDINLQDVLDYSAGGLPYTGLHPFIGLAVDTYQYMTGKNPYNAFTGRYVIPEQVFEAGGTKAAKEFGKHAANQLGIGIVYKFKGADLRQSSSELEKLLGYPIVGRAIERFLKVSDYGLTEEIKRTVKPVRQERAQENIAISDRIIEDVKGKKEISEQDVKRLYMQLHDEGILTRKEYSDFRDTYKLMAIRKVGDPYIKAYMAAKSNEEKMAIMNMIMKEKESK